jgi:hypothetical protein
MSEDLTEYGTEDLPGQKFLMSCLQKPIKFSINNKIIKQGKLLLFRKTHYYIQISLYTAKATRENFEIPFPFKWENYQKEGLLYFDYRITSLGVDNLPPIVKKVSSSYFDKILEIQIIH